MKISHERFKKTKKNFFLYNHRVRKINLEEERQFENAKPMYKAKNITFGDIHDINGEILNFKKK